MFGDGDDDGRMNRVGSLLAASFVIDIHPLLGCSLFRRIGLSNFKYVFH